MRDHAAAEKRIAAVFGSDKAPEVGKESLQIYRAHLLRHFDKEAVLTGREDFLWEEFYVFGPGDKDEYEELKKTRASYTDTFALVAIPKKTIEGHDLIARVRRLSDGKAFEIGLSWLTTKKKRTEAYQLLDDFASWIVNCQ
ncbi:MAG: hypothetical protein ACYC7L_06605 [Nitrospirota bacterium]